MTPADKERLLDTLDLADELIAMLRRLVDAAKRGMADDDENTQVR